MKFFIFFCILRLFAYISRAQVLQECSIKTSDQVTEILPNYSGSTQPCSYSGFAPLDSKAESALFYWYFPNFKNKPKAPFIVWLHGKLGYSDLFGCLVENLCPFTLTKDTTGTYKLNLNESLQKHSWISDYNLLFIDSPVGTGYSYTSHNNYPKDILDISEALWKALQHFLKIHPETLDSNWYFGGESFAGSYIPILSSLTFQYNDDIKLGAKKGVEIPLKGNILGNPLIHNVQQTIAEIDNANLMTLLAPYQIPQAKALAANCQSLTAKKDEKGAETCNLISEYIESVSGINPNSIQITANTASLLKSDYIGYLSQSEVKRILHAINPKESEITIKNSSDNSRLPKIDFSSPSITTIKKVLTQIPCLFFAGHFDAKEGSSSLFKWIELLQNPWNKILEQTRNIWYLNGIPVGFWITYNNLTLITITNAGNFVPYFRPEVTKNMLDIYFTDNNWDCFQNTTNVTTTMCKYMNNCNGHGKCSPGGKCICDQGYFLEDCSLKPKIYDPYLKTITLQPREFAYYEFAYKEDQIIVIEGQNVSFLNFYISNTNVATYSQESSGVSLAGSRIENFRKIYLNSVPGTSKSVFVTIQNNDFRKSLSFNIEIVQYTQEFQDLPTFSDILKPLGVFILTFVVLIVTKMKLNNRK